MINELTSLKLRRWVVCIITDPSWTREKLRKLIVYFSPLFATVNLVSWFYLQPVRQLRQRASVCTKVQSVEYRKHNETVMIACTQHARQLLGYLRNFGWASLCREYPKVYTNDCLYSIIYLCLCDCQSFHQSLGNGWPSVVLTTHSQRTLLQRLQRFDQHNNGCNLLLLYIFAMPSNSRSTKYCTCVS